MTKKFKYTKGKKKHGRGNILFMIMIASREEGRGMVLEMEIWVTSTISVMFISAINKNN